jgi:SAM-dependent methyltransferase
VTKLDLADYPFESSDYLHYLRTLYKDRGLKSLYQLFNRPHRRSYSRSLIKRFAPHGVGLEIGCGARTISPTNRTVLSDAFSDHGVHNSIAKVFFNGDTIPYGNETFDFILSEHVVEHLTNPVKVFLEWIRVLKKGGVIICFLPHPDRTNDRFRPRTTMEHLIEDFSSDPAYNDDAHFLEWYQNVVERGLMPEHYRHQEREELLDSASIHHHVFDPPLLGKLFDFLELETLLIDPKVSDRRDSFVLVGLKSAG